MANKRRGEAVITLDRPRNLKLTFNAMCEAEGVLKHAVVRGDFGLEDIRALLWAGMKHEDRSLTLNRVGDLMNEADIPLVMEQLAEALGDFFGEKAVAEGDDNKGEDSGAGSS